MRVSLKGSVTMALIEEGWIRPGFGLAQNHQGQFARVVIAPHRAFAVGNFLAFGDVVPAVWAVINRMQEKPLVLVFNRQIWLIKNRVRNREGCLSIPPSL